MILRSGTEQTRNFVDFRDGESSFFASEGLQVEKANGEFFSCSILVNRNLGKAFRTALDIGHDRKVWTVGLRRLRAGQDAHRTRCARAPCVQIPCVRIAQRSRHSLALVDRLHVADGLSLVSKLRCADSDSDKPFITRLVATRLSSAERGPARCIGFAESSGARKNAPWTDFDKKVDKPAREYAALCSRIANIGV